VLVEPLDGERAAGAVVGGDALHVPRELAHQVAPGRPHGEADHDRIPGLLDAELDVEEVPVGLGHFDAVEHGPVVARRAAAARISANVSRGEEMERPGGDTRHAAPEARGAAPKVRVFLLGRFEVVRGDAPIPLAAWRRRRPADLLKLVAITPGRALPREGVIDALWPDKDAASGADNLHRGLYDLRQVLGGRFVDLERGQVRLRADVWVDADAFEAAAGSAAPGAAEQAISLYRGDLCPEDGDAPWLAGRRVALRARLAEVALPLARGALERGEGAAVVPLLRRVLDAGLPGEEPHLLLARALADSGRRADALRAFDACEAALRARGLHPPSPELRALRDAVQRGEVGASPPRAPWDGQRRAARRLLGTSEPPPLRGRAASLVLFGSLVESGAGSLVLLGERGVGKTRLAVEGARMAQEAGALVAYGVFQASGAAPYAAFAELFAEWLRGGGAGADPFAERAGPAGGPEAARARLHEAVKAQLQVMGGGRPLYLLLDDLHLADEPSVNLFHDLARSARTLRLMLVATCREDAVHAGAPVQMLLAHLDCERLARGVRVQRLDLAASRALVEDVLGAPPGEALAAQIYRAADGSPFYTEELARAFRESGQLRLTEDPAAVVRERVARLGPKVLALVEAAAVAGRAFDFEVVRGACGLTAHEAVAALDLALAARVVDEDGAGHHFHHSLVREAIYGALPPERRTALHRALADAIEASARGSAAGVEEVAEELAHHRRAGDQPDRAFGHLAAAGHRAAARSGLREAIACYEAALALADGAGAPGPRRLELLEALGAVQLALAELPGALRTFDEAAGLSDPSGWASGPEQRARARRGAALALLAAGRAGDARAQLDAGLADAMAGPGDERAETLHLAAQLAWHEGRPAEALAAAHRCAAEARAVGDLALAARGEDVAALAGGALGEPPVDAAPPAAERGPEAPFEVHLVLWEHDLVGDRPIAELERSAAAFRARAALRQAPTAVGVARAVEGALALRAGHLDLADAALGEAARVLRGAGSALGEAFALDARAELLTARGRLEEALNLLGEGVLVAERAQLRRHALARLHATLASNRLAAGAVYAAEDATREASELLARHGECSACHARFAPQLVRVHLRRGRVAEAERAAGELEALAAARGGRALAAIAREARAHVLAAAHRSSEAAAAFGEVAAAFDALGRRLDSALARARAARALRAEGGAKRLLEADALARQAAEVLAPAGAVVEG
jgi:DNA-binding SARP family transcriptional activator/tetratricopeptide (TPR) repeat protein